MLLKNPITRAKKLFHKNLRRFKTSLSKGYQKLPITPSFNPCSCIDSSNLNHSFRDLNNSFHTDPCTDNDEKKMTTTTKRKLKIKDLTKDVQFNDRECLRSGSFMKFASRRYSEKSDRLTGQEIVEGAGSSSRRLRFHACRIVSERLKELERIEVSDVDHVLDVEEVLHYYSRITCPLYVDIFNKFFLEMFGELLPQTSLGNISRRITNQ
ncbi:uncharacterized protein LOC131223091 [Magnolia sinica]|uniref:uncharacterized protein LOC131223091 n=1 Tax=Magnolia sinica TaxID=86752 RepID=UPI002658A8FE|nr:uncharacterized protein LOC131223091 [Magnolia sinica]